MFHISCLSRFSPSWVSSRNCSGSPTAMVVVGRPYRKPRGIQYKTISVSCHNHMVANSNCRRWSALSKTTWHSIKNYFRFLPKSRGRQQQLSSLVGPARTTWHSIQNYFHFLPKPRVRQQQWSSLVGPAKTT